MIVTFTTDLCGIVSKPITFDVHSFEVHACRDDFKNVYYAVYAKGYYIGSNFLDLEFLGTNNTFLKAEKIIADFKEKYGWRDD
jgi:hypothetical protein